MNLREQLAMAQAEVARIWRAIEREENPTPKRPAMRALEDKLLAQTTFSCDVSFTIDAIRVERDANPESARNHSIWLKNHTLDEYAYARALRDAHPELDKMRLAKHFVVEASVEDDHLASEMRLFMKHEAPFVATDHEVLVICDLVVALKRMSDQRFNPLLRALKRILALTSATSDEGRAALSESKETL